ncbi:MAG: ABC transporter permease [Dehalococcoidia bacterium]
MTRYIARRLLLMVPLIFGVTLVTFILINLIPGSPVSDLRVNPRARPEDAARIEEQLGLNRPWYERYWEWISHLARGDLGLSLHNYVPVRDRIMAVLPNTLLLTTSSLVFALALAVPLGVYAAVRHKTWFDHAATVGGVALFAMPSFWLALLLVILFAFKFREWGLPALPATGITDVRGGGGFFDRVEHLLLPMVALGAVQVGAWSAYIRSAMLEVLQQDYIRTARAKGLAQKVVLFRHAFRNAFLPLVTLVGLSLPGLFGGAIFIESVFAWNGVGLLTLESVGRRDYTMVMGTTLMFAVLTMVANLFADIMYAVLDPRIRYD